MRTIALLLSARPQARLERSSAGAAPPCRNTTPWDGTRPAPRRKSNGPGSSSRGRDVALGANGGLLHRDRDVHAERDVRHAVALVDAGRRPRKRDVVFLVRLRQ